MRFIPAGAGNTSQVQWRVKPSAVYPRWRGEHRPVPDAVLLIAGLSPLARGTQRLMRLDCTCIRFIPAGAGNTLASASTSRACSVYPRWRGEHAPASGHSPKLAGLSPLARGTRTLAWAVCFFSRFIPAGAGNTPPRSPFLPLSLVYPRWRGEHIDTVQANSDRCGLSPLARGTQLLQSRNAGAIRFIPAGAGNTMALFNFTLQFTVYPRWRGEHSKTICLFYFAFFSETQSTNLLATILHY